MFKRIVVAAIVFVVLCGVRPQPSAADPCGMVPPIYVGSEIPLARVGLQQTYVFHQDGVETFVIRPGFTGKVEEFGMLIPFPAPPALRKVPDQIFQHLAAAVDPPEVLVDLRPRFLPQLAARAPRTKNKEVDDALAIRKDEVRVIKQEAVGMYEVAVLEAGSAQALKRWMDQHSYKYPDGMDTACEDYVQDGWCFVAVKTKVGQKSRIDPRPGQRDVDANLPKGSAFDGHVQGMGFRFPVDELIVPMRLSAFNAGKLRNVVYLLTTGPRKIQRLSEDFVVRQLPGEQLFKHVTQPLPVRIIGGTEADIPDWRRRELPKQRDPAPKNGAAKELFAADILAATTGELALPHEEDEKELLRIGERLGLRGPDIDKLNTDTLSEQRAKTVERALGGVKQMTLTVIDGDFPRDFLRQNNLTFASYRMPDKRNRPQSYDAKLNGPAPHQEGIRLGAISPRQPSDESTDKIGSTRRSATRGGALSVLAIAVVGLVVVARRRSIRHAVGACMLVFLSAALFSQLAAAQDQGAANEDAKARPPIRELLRDLSDGERAEEAIAALVARADEAKGLLMGEALEGNDLARRGWAIVALAEIGGDDVEQHLTKLHSDAKQPMLIRTWAAAARVYLTDSTVKLIARADLAQQFPAVGRPLGMRVVESLGSKDAAASPEDLLSLAIQVPQLQQAVAPAILALGPEKLAAVMTTANRQDLRIQAAAYLGTLSNQGDNNVGSQVIKAYSFDPGAKQVPWSGGPLYVPGIRWDKETAQSLVGNLIAWHLWCDRQGKRNEQQQINNNLNSITLATVAGYQFGAQDTVSWLTAWGKVVGRKEIERILQAQGVQKDRKYSGVLERL